MNGLDTVDPLNTIVGEALRADADHAPHLPSDWPGVDRMSATGTRQPRLRHFTLIAAAAAVVLVCAGLAFLARTTEPETTPATAPASWIPGGTEFPLTDLGPATDVFGGPVVDALTRQVGVPGHPPQVITTSLTYSGGETAVEQLCTSELGSSGCRSEDNSIPWSSSVTSSIDNRVANYDLWTLEGLPADVAFVSYTDGDEELWQRPIAGFAAFPNVEGNSEVVIAYDRSGGELGRYGFAEYETALTDQAPALQADLSKADYEQLGETTADAVADCLTANGGTIVAGGVATFDAGVDQVAIWNECVVTVKQEVAAAVEAIGPRYFDPATERPENPDSPFVFGD